MKKERGGKECDKADESRMTKDDKKDEKKDKRKTKDSPLQQHTVLHFLSAEICTKALKHALQFLYRKPFLLGDTVMSIECGTHIHGLQ